MSSQLPPGGIAFSSDINDHGSDKNRKWPQSMHFPLPFAPAMSPIVYPTPTPNSNEKNEKIATSDMPDMEMGQEVDDGDAPKPDLFTMPNKRTAFLCPHGLHISDTIVDDDAGLGTESDSQGHLQTRCLVCDVMREYHPYQLQTADPMVGEQWIRYMDFICGVRDERIMGEVGAVRDIADRCVTLAEDLLARQKNLLADIRKMNVAPVGTADDEDDEFGKESTELLGGEKKEQQKEELKKSVRNKINIDEAASQNELEDEEISAAFRISIKRMEWMDEETLKESFKQCIGDDDKEAIVLKHVIAERKRIAAEKEIVDNKNIVKKRHDRENRKNGLMDIILKKRRQVEKKEAEDQRVAGALRILLDQRLAEQETESRLRAKKNKKAGKQKQAQVSDAADVDKLDLITGLGLRDNRVIGKPSGNVPGSRPYHVQSGTSGSKREFFEFIESGPTE